MSASDDRNLRRAARRKVALAEGGIRAWRGRATTFMDRKKENDKRACRVRVQKEENDV